VLKNNLTAWWGLGRGRNPAFRSIIKTGGTRKDAACHGRPARARAWSGPVPMHLIGMAMAHLWLRPRRTALALPEFHFSCVRPARYRLLRESVPIGYSSGSFGARKGVTGKSGVIPARSRHCKRGNASATTRPFWLGKEKLGSPPAASEPGDLPGEKRAATFLRRTGRSGNLTPLPDNLHFQQRSRLFMRRADS
jgi:hypothetical protein